MRSENPTSSWLGSLVDWSDIAALESQYWGQRTKKYEYCAFGYVFECEGLESVDRGFYVSISRVK